MPVAEAARPRAPRSCGPVPPAPDPVLVARLREGDESAFEAIFHRHHPPLLSFCRHMLGGRDDAEDAVQQTFIRAHRALRSDSPPRELRPWLYAIARNCCHSAIAARRPAANIEDHEPSLAGLSEEVRAREDLRELVGDLQALPEDQRSALLLAELEDLTHLEIAAIVECPVKKVKALIHQARTTLIAQRDARAAPCQEIRMQLSIACGGELRRGPLRRHLGVCPGCREYASAVRGQRLHLAAILPVAPSAGLATRVLGHGAVHAGGFGVAGAGHGAAAIAAGSGSSCGAVAGASSSAGVSLAVGGGLAAKLALGGAVAVIASAGAAATTLRHRTHHHGTAVAALRSGRSLSPAAPSPAPHSPASVPVAVASSRPSSASRPGASSRSLGARPPGPRGAGRRTRLVHGRRATATGPGGARRQVSQRRALGLRRHQAKARRQAKALSRRRRRMPPVAGPHVSGGPRSATSHPPRRRLLGGSLPPAARSGTRPRRRGAQVRIGGGPGVRGGGAGRGSPGSRTLGSGSRPGTTRVTGQGRTTGQRTTIARPSRPAPAGTGRRRASGGPGGRQASGDTQRGPGPSRRFTSSTGPGPTRRSGPAGRRAAAFGR